MKKLKFYKIKFYNIIIVKENSRKFSFSKF